MSRDQQKLLLKKLPFSFTSISKETSLSKNALRNYFSRGIPKRYVKKIRDVLLKKLIKKLNVLRRGLIELKLISSFDWDEIEKIEEIEYNDYVYDFVVPDAHTFIGGNLPTIFHNTQLGFQLAVNVQLPKEKGGLRRGCVFIDSENTFSPHRIISIAKSKGLDPHTILKNIHYTRSFNSDHQMIIVEKLPESVDLSKVGLIIVDSLTSHFRADYIGRGELAARQQKLNKHLHQLQKLADAYNLAVYVTNQVMADPSVLFGDPTRAIGGHVLGHMSFYRIYLRRGKSGTRIARVVDAPDLPESEAVFKITNEGIKDV